MTNLEITLTIILYVFLAVITYGKQMKFSKTPDDKFIAQIIAFFAPISMLVYAIRTVFFEDWI